MDNKRPVIYPKSPKGEDGYKAFSIRIKEELVERINDISGQTEYSRNELSASFWNTRSTIVWL